MGSFNDQPMYDGHPVYEELEVWWGITENTVHWSEAKWDFPAINEESFAMDIEALIEDTIDKTDGLYYNTYAERLVVVPEGILVLHDIQCFQGLEWMLLNPNKKVGEYRSRISTLLVPTEEKSNAES